MTSCLLMVYSKYILSPSLYLNYRILLLDIWKNYGIVEKRRAVVKNNALVGLFILQNISPEERPFHLASTENVTYCNLTKMILTLVRQLGHTGMTVFVCNYTL